MEAPLFNPMNETPKPKCLAKGMGHDKATAITVLLSLGLWDQLSIADREAWCERSEIMDTPGGRLLFNALDAMGGFGH